MANEFRFMTGAELLAAFDAAGIVYLGSLPIPCWLAPNAHRDIRPVCQLKLGEGWDYARRQRTSQGNTRSHRAS